MGIKFKSPLALSAHRAIAHSDSAQTLEVKVVVKTAAHPEFGNGSANGYTIDGVEGAYLEFTPGNTYKFDQSDSSNTGHPLRFYEDAAKTVAYTTGVTTSGTPGTAGAYTQIVPTTSTNPILYYQCSAHSLMGSYVKFGTGSLGGEADSAIKILLTVKNVSSGTLASGTVVRVAPTANPPSGNVLEVDIADNSAASTMPAVGVLIEDITAGSEGNCVAFGRASGFSTSGYTEGDTLYVNTSGDFTTTKPTGTALIQRIGQVIKVHASNGSIEVFGAGRANDLPNIPQDQVWLGNSNGVATPTDHTVENISNVTVSSKTDGQALVWDATNSYWKNGTVSGGGGGGTVTVEKNIYTGDGSDTTFDTSTAIVNENNVQVYIDGVYQSKDNYTTNGSTVTFSTAPPNTTSVELIHMVAVDGVIARDGFTGNGSTTAFVLSMSITNENATQVYIDGVYQSKDNYTTSGSTLTFSTAPPNGAAVEVVHIKAVDASSLNQNSFTGNGSTTAFTLSQSIDDENKTFVFIQGVYQEKSTYSISGNTITFSTAPQSGYTVEVMAFSAISLAPAVSITGGTGISVVTNSPNNFTVSNTLVDVTVSWATPSGQSLTYTNPSPQSSIGQAGSIFPTTTFTITKAANTLSGTAVLTGLPTGVTIVSQSYNNNNPGNVLTITLGGVYPSANALNTGIIVSGLTATAAPPVVDYLVVAGGAGGGGGAFTNANGGGGGGGGGLRTSYGSITGGGGSSESSLSLAVSTNYTVTVGSGGAGGVVSGDVSGLNGSNSVFYTSTAIGGGGGGGEQTGKKGGKDGGSGGGASYQGTIGQAVTSPVVHGFDGGNFNGAAAGGGGGATSAGSNGQSSNGIGGDGGAGLTSSITGVSESYAGGGGGGGYNNGGGSGGIGGGGDAGQGVATAGSDGTANTGGGGGGARNRDGAAAGGSGGSGVVILRYSNAYTVTIGSGLTGSTATDGSDKVTTFTAGTGNISFS